MTRVWWWLSKVALPKSITLMALLMGTRLIRSVAPGERERDDERERERERRSASSGLIGTSSLCELTRRMFSGFRSVWINVRSCMTAIAHVQVERM
jgi:hypothetical protein